MREISLHILDIAQNSITAGASLVEITITEDIKKDILSVKVKDNGKGMSKELLESVTSPFTTGRTTRKVGLGIPLIKNAAELTGGSLKLTSELGVGTTLLAEFIHSSIDRQPLGDMAETMLSMITSYEEIDFIYTHTIDGKEFTFDTKKVKEVLGGISLKEPEVYLWIKESLTEGEESIK